MYLCHLFCESFPMCLCQHCLLLLFPFPFCAMLLLNVFSLFTMYHSLIFYVNCPDGFPNVSFLYCWLWLLHIFFLVVYFICKENPLLTSYPFLHTNFLDIYTFTFHAYDMDLLCCPDLDHFTTSLFPCNL